MNLSNISNAISGYFQQIYANAIGFIEDPNLFVNLINTLCVMVVCMGIIGVFVVWEEYQRATIIFRKTNKKVNDVDFLKDVLLKELYTNVRDIKADKGKTREEADKTVLIMLGIIAFISVFLLFVNQIFFAAITPFVLLFVFGKLTGLMKKTRDDYIQEQLPMALDNIVRTFTKYNDLRTVLYESTNTLRQPMQGMIANLANDMMNKSPDAVLEDFADETNNIWINSMCFILLNYLGTTPKKEVVENLRNLRDIIQRDNKAKNKERLERKMTVMINYVLCGIVVLGFLGNLLVNPMAQDFFFSTALGLGCFLVGLGCLILSVFSNLLISSGK